MRCRRCIDLSKHDIMLGNHRSHGHYLAKGGDLPKMIYEVFGDRRGCCKGYGGSMHMLDRSVGFNGSTPILGSVPSLAVGQSFACQQSGIDNVTVVFLGDGAAEEGSFMESINLAANKQCQIIFVIEDNKYSVNSNMLDRKSEHYCHKGLFEGLGAIYFRENGQDVKAVHNATVNAVRAAKTKRPAVLHLETIRRHAHSGPILETENQDYRGDETIEYREENDCIALAMDLAVSDGVAKGDLEKLIRREQAETLDLLREVKSSIEVRSFD